MEKREEVMFSIVGEACLLIDAGAGYTGCRKTMALYQGTTSVVP
jgi:hypothetical protein